MMISAKKLLTLAALLLAATQIWAKPNIPNLGSQCAGGKLNACGELAKIALEDKDALVRKSAVEMLLDQAVLAKLAAGDKEAFVRLAAVQRLTDQGVLAKIAIEDNVQSVCLAAEGKLSNQPMLAKVALDAKDALVRRDAVLVLEDQSLLATIAEGNGELTVRQAAVARLNSQPLLEKVAIGGDNPFVRAAAVRMLTDQSLVLKFAAEGQDDTVRRAAVLTLSDQSLIARFATADKDPKVRRIAVQRMNDQGLMAKIAAEDKDSDVREAAMMRLTDQTLIATLVAKDPDVMVRTSVAEMLVGQGFLAKLQDKDEKVRKTARAALSSGGFVVDEHEVYVWKAPTDDENLMFMPRSKWTFHGVLGAAHTPGNLGNLLSDQAEVFGEARATGFQRWDFKPESETDSCALESGSIRLTAGGPSEVLAPITFRPIAFQGEDGSGWEGGVDVFSAFYRPFLYVALGGRTLALGGAIVFVGPGGGHLLSVKADPVTVTGTIRFPNDDWTSAGGGLSIKGGGLQFDETGAFLIVGTEFRKDAQR
jgi:hypothetical protein